MARTLGISLVWLVAGEGSLQVEPNIRSMDEQFSSEKATLPRAFTRSGKAPGYGGANAVDAQRLATAVKILQTELGLAGKQFSLSDNTDLLSELYEILGPGGSHVDPLAMVTFHHHLAERIRIKTGTA